MTVVMGAVLLASAAGAQYQPGQPGLVLSPSTTTPGGTITALGFGCGANQTVTITIDGNVVGTGTSANDGKGSFSIPFTAPTTPGTYTVTAKCGDTLVSSILTVIASPTTTAPAPPLPPTGSGSTLPLTRFALVLIAGGGLLVLAVRKRRES
jgi:hypothetical protein